jgi:diguanylate cyclase (GGDEF)-like protein
MTGWRVLRVRAWQGSIGGWAFGALPYAVFALVAAGTLTQPAGSPAYLISMLLGLFVLSILGLGFGLWAAFSKSLDRADRKPWRFLAAHSILAQVTGASLGPGGDVPRSLTGFGVAVAGRVVLTLLVVVGVLSFAHDRLSKKARYRFLMDITVVLGGSFMLIWYLLVGPVLSGGERGIGFRLVTASFAIADVVMLLSIVAVLLRGVRVTAVRPLGLLAAGLIAYLLVDLGITSRGVMMPGLDEVNRFGLLMLVAPTLFFTSAAIEQRRVAHRVRADGAQTEGPVRSSRRPSLWPPYLSLLLAFVLLVVAAARSGLYPWAGLVAGTVMIVAGLAGRQLVMLRENQALLVSDSLTGLANRLRVRERLENAVRRAHQKATAAVLLIDLDGFKQVNDTFGHEAGDEMLVAFADVLRRTVRQVDTTARLGGDEFVIILDGVADADTATAVAARILEAAAEPVMIAGHPMPIRASIGVATTDPTDDYCPPAELLHRADIAMYVAKRQQTTGWHLYHPGDSDPTKDIAGLAADLGLAVAAGELRLSYQPIVGLDTGDLIAVEALVRWQHPVQGLLAPDAFIALAEKTGTIQDIGRWVLETACRQARVWQERLPPGRSLQLSVNISALELEREDMAAAVLSTIERTGFDPHQLVLEVSESSLSNYRSATEKINIMRARGVRFALDAFGTGHASLRQLMLLPFDILKIDRCFVAELDGDPQKSAIVEAVIRLSQVLNLDTMAGGVERPAQATALSRLGCQTAQGYHFATPLSAHDMDRLVDDADRDWPCLPNGPIDADRASADGRPLIAAARP